jgi:hypothetical protein
MNWDPRRIRRSKDSLDGRRDIRRADGGGVDGDVNREARWDYLLMAYVHAGLRRHGFVTITSR